MSTSYIYLWVSLFITHCNRLPSVDFLYLGSHILYLFIVSTSYGNYRLIAGNSGYGYDPKVENSTNRNEVGLPFLAEITNRKCLCVTNDSIDILQ